MINDEALDIVADMLNYLQTHKQTVKLATITINDLTLGDCQKQAAVSAVTATCDLATVGVLTDILHHPYAVKDIPGTQMATTDRLSTSFSC